MRRRRREADPYKEQMGNVYRSAKMALFGPVRSTMSKVLHTTLDELVAQNQKQVGPILQKIQSMPEYRLLLQPCSEQLELQLKFMIPSTEELPMDTWLDGFQTGSYNLSTSFKLAHDMMYGADPYGGTFNKRDTYSSVYKLEMCIHPPYTIDGQTPINGEHEEYLTQMLNHLLVLRKEFPVWAEQFRNSGAGKILSSHAAYYSSTVGNWLRSLRYEITPYVRRPNSPYTVPMSPELNTALSIALSLKDANGVEEAFL